MATNKKSGKWRARTVAVRGGQMRTPFQETSEALFLTSGYAYESPEQAEARFKGEDDGFQYTRFANPTVSMFEERMAALEGAQVARATASGMAAVSAALLSGLSAGDHIVAAKAMFGSCRYVIADLLPRFGVAHTLVDGGDLDQWRDAMRPETRMLFLETPANPTLAIVDIAAVAKIADERGARLVVDNAFASPVLQRPMEFGAAYRRPFRDEIHRRAGPLPRWRGPVRRGFPERSSPDVLSATPGPPMSPFNAWVHLKSLETLDLRMRAHCENAARVADFLADQRKVTRVLYPFRPDHPQHNLARAQMDAGGGVVTFEVAGGKAAAYRFAGALNLIDISNNLGDAKSLITHPETTTHQRLSPEARAELGVTSGLMRLSVGLEDLDDLCEDLEQALKAA